MSSTQTPTPPAPQFLEQYKTYISDLGNIGTRYATSNGFHLSVVTALLGILALTKPNEAFEGSKVYLGLVVSVFAVLVCMVWSKSVASYRKTFAIKFAVLRQMEQEGHLFPIYTLEDQKRGKLSVLESDRYIPLLLSVPFLVALVLIFLKLNK